MPPRTGTALDISTSGAWRSSRKLKPVYVPRRPCHLVRVFCFDGQTSKGDWVHGLFSIPRAYIRNRGASARNRTALFHHADHEGRVGHRSCLQADIWRRTPRPPAEIFIHNNGCHDSPNPTPH